MQGPPKRSQFMTITGTELVQDVYPCGCFHETEYLTDGTVELIRFQACTACFDRALETLDQMVLDKQSQLTLGLASERERGQDGS